MNRRQPGWGMLLLLILIGGLIFGYLGEVLVSFVPVLSRFGAGNFVGIPAISLNLAVVKLSFGFLIKVNIFSVIGFILGYLTYRRM